MDLLRRDFVFMCLLDYLFDEQVNLLLLVASGSRSPDVVFPIELRINSLSVLLDEMHGSDLYIY